MQAPTANSCSLGTFTYTVQVPTLRGMNQSAHTRPIHAIRWQNFRLLLEDRGLTITAASQQLDKAQGQVSHFGGQRPTKPIGDQIAGEIEERFNLPAGWMDQDRREGTANERPVTTGQASQNPQLDLGMLALAEQWVRFEETAELGAKAVGIGFLPMRRAERLIALYNDIKADGGHLAPERAEAIIKAARDRTTGRTDAQPGRSSGRGSAGSGGN